MIELSNPNQNIAVIVLAAGSSSRLGKPKQLLHYQGNTLIKQVIKTASAISKNKVIVVTGFLHQELDQELNAFPVMLVYNPDWEQGMGSSIRTGIKALQKLENSNQINAALFLLSDQPLITTAYLHQLIAQFYLHKNSMIAATSYAGTHGVPAVFDKSIFPELEQLSGKSGAQKIFKNHLQELITLPFEDAAIDIDTKEDYQNLINPIKKNK